MPRPIPAVYDCNVYLRAMLSSTGPSFQCLQLALANQVELLLCPGIILELRRLPLHRDLQRFRWLSPDFIEAFIDRIRPTSQLLPDPTLPGNFCRDPNDDLYIKLAIESRAFLLITNDNDLLTLQNPNTPPALHLRTTHPNLNIASPQQFLASIPDAP